MRSELFRIPLELGGVPLFGGGVLLLLWLIVSAIGLWWAAKSSSSDDTPWTSYLPVVGIVSLVLIFLPRFAPEGLPIRGYGVMLLLAASVGIGLATHRAQQRGLIPDVIFSLTFWMFICGIAGARLFFVIEYWETEFSQLSGREALVKAFQFTEGGLVVYGSLIGATLAFIVFCYRHKLSTLAMADLLAPSLVVGLSLGRIGCLLNGCCYGGVCDQPWAITFPKESPPYMDQLAHGQMYGFRLAESVSSKSASSDSPAESGKLIVAEANPERITQGLAPGTEVIGINGRTVETFDQAAGLLVAIYAAEEPLTLQLTDGKSFKLPAATIRERSLPVHPTQIYSTINAALLAFLLWHFYPYRTRDGQVIALLLTLYPITRFLLEIIRTDEAAIFGTGLSISQNVSLLILAGVVALWFYLWRQPRTLVPLAS